MEPAKRAAALAHYLEGVGLRATERLGLVGGRVLRLMRAHRLLSTHRAAFAPAKAHAGRITTYALDELPGTKLRPLCRGLLGSALGG